MRTKLEEFKLPAGQGGINRSKNLLLMAPTDLTYAETVTIERDILEKEPGAALFNGQPLADGAGTWSVNGLQEFVYGNPLVQELLAYIDNGLSASWVVAPPTAAVTKKVLSNLATGGYPVFAEGWDGAKRTVYLATGLDQPMSYNGTTPGTVMATLANGGTIPSDWQAPYWPTGFVPHKQRMVGFGNLNFPHNVYLSVPGSHSDYNAGGSAVQPVYQGEGQRIAGCASWRERLYIFKYPRGVYLLDDTDPDPANWFLDKVTDALGVCNQGSIIPIEDDVVILGSDGYFYALSQIRTLGQVAIPPFLPLETAQFIQEKINTAQLSVARGVWFGHTRQIQVAVPSGSSTFNNARAILDLHNPGKAAFFWSTRDICPGMGLRRSPTVNDVQRPCIGDKQGNIYTLDQQARDKNGAGYTGQYELPPFSAYKEKRYMNLAELVILMDPQGNYNLTVEVQRDGKVSQTLQYSMNTPGAAVGSLSLDADVLAGQTVATVKHELTGECVFCKVIGSNNQPDQNFAVMQHEIRFKAGRAL